MFVTKSFLQEFELTPGDEYSRESNTNTNNFTNIQKNVKKFPGSVYWSQETLFHEKNGDENPVTLFL
jgi:hypothetical protein